MGLFRPRKPESACSLLFVDLSSEFLDVSILHGVTIEIRKVKEEQKGEGKQVYRGHSRQDTGAVKGGKGHTGDRIE